MYRAYMVPDATQFRSRAEMYQSKLLLWDPLSESDACAIIGPKLKTEMNKAEAFEFTVLPSNVCYDHFHKKISVVMVYDDDEWICEGVVSDCPKDFYKQMKVTCSGPLSYLCDSVQAPDESNEITVPTSSGQTYVRVPKQWYNNANPHDDSWYERSSNPDSSGNYTYTLSRDTVPSNRKKYYYLSTGDGENYSGTTYTKTAGTSETIGDHLSRMLDVHNSQVEPYKVIRIGRCIGDTTSYEFDSSNYRETWSAIKSDIIEQYGRYITIRIDDNYELYLNYLELRDMDPHTTPETTIEFTENMIEMSESDDSDDDIFTVLVPIGKNSLTVSGVSGHDYPEYNDNRYVDPYISTWGGSRRYVLVSRYALGRYGIIVKTQTFSDADTADELWTEAVKYIKNNFDAHVEYEVKGIDAHILDPSKSRIIVGKKCRVKSGWHGVDEKDLFVISAEHDLLSPDNDSYKIGIPTSDREATNKTLTSQTTSSATSSANSASNLSSSVNNLASWLENYFTENEGWLELHNKFRNQVESDNGMFRTRLEQDEKHINIAAEKIFGVPGSDGVDNQDAGWILIPKPPYRKNGNGVEDYYESSDTSDTRYKVPSEHNWYIKGSDGKYTLSTQDTRVTQAQVNDSNMNFYIMRLATRYSNIDVGPEGIKGRVDGNYERSTYCSSWIDSNEDSILALTGHLYVDEEGHVHVTSGAGMRTDHAEEGTTPEYVQVPRTTYSQNPNPNSKHWYERKLNGYGKWLGEGQSDSATNDTYYVRTNDITIDRSKYYYYKSNVRETFLAEYGVYDEDNLTAGVVARVINNPTYHKVSMTEVNALKIRKGSPRAQGWFEYDETTGQYGITLDTEVESITKNYYTVTNNMQSWTDIWGEHVVVGRTKGYSGMDAATKARVDKYIADHNLDGTITEIASDVVVVNALIAKYIETDEIIVNTMLAADNGYFNRLYVGMKADVDMSEGGIASVYGDFDWLSGGHINATSLTFSPIGSSVGFGYDGGGDVGVSRLASPDDIVMGFGTITTSGDTVTIPYTTLYDYCQNETDASHVLSFDKPASLGSVTWSSGSKTLTAKTVGGRDFLVGTITPFSPSGQSEAQEMASAGYLATETTGYNTVYGINYTAKDANGNDWARKTMLFKTPRNRYPDAVSTIKTYSSDNKTDGADITLAYGTNVKIFAQYKTELQLDSGDVQNTSLAGITVRHDVIGVDGPTTFSPSNQSEAQEAANATELAYGQIYSISGTYGGTRVGTRKLFRTKTDRYNSGKDDGANTLAISPSSNKTLDYGKSQTVTATTTKSDGTTVTKSVTITAPGDNSSPSYGCDDIRVGETDIKSSKPNDATELSWGSSIASADGKWFVFEAWLNGDKDNGTKKYAINLR